MIRVNKPKKLRKGYMTTLRLERDHVEKLLDFYPPEFQNLSQIVRQLIEEDLKKRVLLNPHGQKTPMTQEEKNKREAEFRLELIPRLQSRGYSRDQIDAYLIEHRLAPLSENELI